MRNCVEFFYTLIRVNSVWVCDGFGEGKCYNVVSL